MGKLQVEFLDEVRVDFLHSGSPSRSRFGIIVEGPS
jgi:hypothetical protein